MSFQRSLPRILWSLTASFALYLLTGSAIQAQVAPEGGKDQAASVEHIILILSDDHRYDFMGFMPQAPDFLETPNLDRLAAEGAHLMNAFVSTSLCSPSRGSILTGQYMHHHKIVDNQSGTPEGIHFFPEDFQAAGVHTAFIGKWHMGHEHDEPRPGFDHWVSFRGQGEYTDPVFNINGRRQQMRGYNADLLTDQALAWLESRDTDRPSFLYLSYKAVHYPFSPAPRHDARYAAKPVPYPDTMANTEQNYRTQPRWVRDRRFSIHGVEHMQTGPFDHDPVPDFDAFYRNYCESIYGLDENIGRILDYLDEHDLAASTLVVYMGDNGFHLGEHGFYDKRDAFETSIRVPLLARCPTFIQPGTRVDQMVQNIDIAPTLMAAMKIKSPSIARMDGVSFLPLLQGDDIPWRDHILYEYYWEWNFPATPTLFAIRNERYKFVYFHGIWDQNAFYDLETDPVERHNLISVPAYQDRIEAMRTQLFTELEASGALNTPIRSPKGERLEQRRLD